jgi:hypothetical protein
LALEGVVVSAGGLRVAQRGAAAPSGAGLQVGGIAPVRTPDVAPTESRRGDGLVWRRHWLDDHRLVIEFVDVALVEVLRDRGVVVFDRQLLPEMEQHLLLDHVLPLVLAAGGEIVVHGGVISLGGKGVVLLGGSGAGKSTLTAHAWTSGWTLGGDDGAVLTVGDPPMVEPTYATVRLTPATTELLGLASEASSPIVGKVRIAGEGRPFAQEPVELRLIANLQPVAAGVEARLDILDAVSAHATLFGSTFHAELKGRLLPAVVARLGTIVESTPVGRLLVPRGLEGLAAAERLLRAQLGNGAADRDFEAR